MLRQGFIWRKTVSQTAEAEIEFTECLDRVKLAYSSL